MVSPFIIFLVSAISLEQALVFVSAAAGAGLVPYLHDLWAIGCLLRDCPCHLITELQSLHVIASDLSIEVDLENGDLDVVFPKLMSKFDRILYGLCGYRNECGSEMFTSGIDFEEFGLYGEVKDAARSLAPYICKRNNIQRGVDGYCMQELADVITSLWSYTTPDEIVRNAQGVMGRMCLTNCVSELDQHRVAIGTLMKEYAPALYQNAAVQAVFQSSKGFNLFCEAYKECTMPSKVEVFISKRILSEKGATVSWNGEQAVPGCMDGSWKWPNDCGTSNYDPMLFHYPRAYTGGGQLPIINNYCKRCSSSGCDNKFSNTRPMCYRIAATSDQPKCPTQAPTQSPSRRPTTVAPTQSPTLDSFSGAYLDDLRELNDCAAVDPSTLEALSQAILSDDSLPLGPARARRAINGLLNSRAMETLCGLPKPCRSQVLQDGIQWSSIGLMLNWTNETVAQIADIFATSYCEHQDEENEKYCLAELRDLTNNWKGNCYLANDCSSCLEAESCSEMADDAGCMWDEFSLLCESRNGRSLGTPSSPGEGDPSRNLNITPLRGAVVMHRSLQVDLPLLPDKLPGVIDNCDLNALLSLADELSAVSQDKMLNVVLENVDALCSKPGCPPAVINALDYSKLPSLNTPAIKTALQQNKNLLCTKVGSAFCFADLALSLTEDAPPLPFCATDCFAELGGPDFLQQARPLMALVAPQGSLGPGLCTAPPSAVPSASPVALPTFPPKPQQATAFCASSCPGALEGADQALVALLQEVTNSDVSISPRDLPGSICRTKAPTGTPTASPLAASPTPAPTRSLASLPEAVTKVVSPEQLVDAIATANDLPGELSAAEVLASSACDWSTLEQAISSVDVSVHREPQEIVSDLFFSEEVISAMCSFGGACAAEVLGSLHKTLYSLPQLSSQDREALPKVLAEFGQSYLCPTLGEPTRRLRTSESPTYCFESYAALVHAQSGAEGGEARRLVNVDVDTASLRIFARREYQQEQLHLLDRRTQDIASVLDISKLLTGTCSLADLLGVADMLNAPSVPGMDPTLGLVLNALGSSAITRQLCYPDSLANSGQDGFTPDCPLELIEAVLPSALPEAFREGPIRSVMERFAENLCLRVTETGAMCLSQGASSLLAFRLEQQHQLPALCRNGCLEVLDEQDNADIRSIVGAAVGMLGVSSNSTTSWNSTSSDMPKLSEELCGFQRSSKKAVCEERSITSKCALMEAFLESKSQDGEMVLAALLGRSVKNVADVQDSGLICTTHEALSEDALVAVGIGVSAGLLVMVAAGVLVRRHRQKKRIDRSMSRTSAVSSSAKKYFINPHYGKEIDPSDF